MKFNATAAAVALLSATFAHALPSNLAQSGFAGAVPVRDPARLAELEARHNETLADLRAGRFAPVQDPRGDQALSGGDNELDKRIAPLVGFGGMFITSNIGLATLTRITNRLHDALGYDSQEIWFDHDRCRVSFETKGGGNEGIWSYKPGATYYKPTGTHKFHAGWNSPGKNDPPVHYFDDAGVGSFSVQFTATDEVAWDGVKGTRKCGFEGLCDPQLVFYRDGYSIVLNTWQSQGSKAECYYSDGKRCGGMCSSGVKDQFASGGMKWAGDCAVPCSNEGRSD
ncbi:hypothetical protein MN608_03137 [Microdochium nivale]|nr:hypothetical protein MN608_03137 [Microdochium nivale]